MTLRPLDAMDLILDALDVLMAHHMARFHLVNLGGEIREHVAAVAIIEGSKTCQAV